MAGRALLQAWDRSRGAVVDLEITWEKGHDVDARVRVPTRFLKVWKQAVASLRQDHRDGSPIEPYPSLPISVPIELVTKSATGIYAISKSVWGEVGWRVPPPFPQLDREDPEVDQ